MMARDFELVAGIIRTLPDEIRQVCADHFADQLNARIPSFDPGAWQDRCGGRVGRAKTSVTERIEADRKARVDAYLKQLASIDGDAH